jgi:hypothetical protein
MVGVGEIGNKKAADTILATPTERPTLETIPNKICSRKEFEKIRFFEKIGW